MKLILFLVLTALSGCMYQSVNNTEIETAIEKCGSVQNIVKIDSFSLGGASIYCKDGTGFILQNGRIK